MKSSGLLLLIITSTVAQALEYSGGSGTPEDPYQIATAEDLMLLGETPEDYDKHFIMTADIDLDPNLPGLKVFDRAVIAPDVNDSGYSFQGTPFTGVLDGNGHAISDLVISGRDYIGLFGKLEEPGEIRNLRLLRIDITGEGYVSGLVSINNGKITASCSQGVLTGTRCIGGLVGCNSGKIEMSYSTVKVTGEYGNNFGGLAGVNAGSVTTSYSTGTVTGGCSVGGLIGSNSGSIKNSYSKGTVHGMGCGPVTSYGGVGGLAGDNSHDAIIINCYSVGKVTAEGWQYDVVGDFQPSVGGLFGESHSPLGGRGTRDIFACFWDNESSGQTRSYGGTGLSPEEMQKYVTFAEAGWGCNPVWTIDEGKDYPRLWWEEKPGILIDEDLLSEFLEGEGTLDNPYVIYTLDDLDTIARLPCSPYKHFRLGFLSGGGTYENPYLIHTADELYLLGMCQYEMDKHFKLMTDVDLSGYSYGRAVIAPDLNDVETDFQGVLFEGVFDGNDNTITHLNITGTSYLGVFGKVDSGAQIMNIKLMDVNITGSGYGCGGLAGINSGAVTNSYSTGSVNGRGGLGGLVGVNSGRLTDCHSTGVVDGIGSVGGLVGSNDNGQITNCSAASNVSGYNDRAFPNSIGGLVGLNEDGTLTGCYSSGTVFGHNSVGGLVGCNRGNISRSYSNSSVEGIKYIGGIVGQNSKGSRIVQCYSFTSINGESTVGGLLGLNHGTLTQCYSIGSVSGSKEIGGLVGYNPLSGLTVTRCYSSSEVNGNESVGGLIGWGFGATNSLWDIQISGQAEMCGGGTYTMICDDSGGKTTGEMQTASTFLEAGWDFVDETTNGTEDIWWILEGQGYPRLWWEAR